VSQSSQDRVQPSRAGTRHHAGFRLVATLIISRGR
jgi:hypothetical protein